MRRIRVVAVLTFFAVFARSASAADGTIVYSHFANAGPLDPHAYMPNQMYAQEMLYEPLVRLDENGRALPCLAESWTVSPDGREYVFTLRPDVVFSDGEKFDAAAVVKNFDRILTGRAKHEWLELTKRIASYGAAGELTFRLVLDAPHAAALADLSLPRPFRFLSPAAFADDGGMKAPAGTGRWKLAESVPGEYDRFERNEFYHGEAPAADAVLVKVIPDPVTRALALQTGEIDLVLGSGQIGYDAFAALRDDPEFATAVSRPMGTVAAALNTARAPTDELAVRLAVQHMADKRMIVDGVFLGAQPMADTLFAPGTPGCDAGLAPYAFDPAKAAALLDGAGWAVNAETNVREKNGAPLVIDFCFNGGDASHKAMAEVLQAQAAAVGMRLNLIGEEEDSFVRRQKDGEFGMILDATWGPPFEPHAMLASMRSPSHADYQAQSGLPMKPELDAAITRALRTPDDAERAELYRRVLAVLHEQAVYLPVHHAAQLAAYRRGVLENVGFGAGQTAFPFENIVKVR